MNVQRLRSLIRSDKTVEALYKDFRRDRPDGDPMAFARWLADHGALTEDQLRDYLIAGDVSFTISEGAGHVRVAPTSRYELLGLLGRGAMGEVHVARDRDLNRNVAVKLMDPGLAKDPALARRFFTEVQVTAQLDHPAIVPVFGVERAPDGTLGYSMRIIRGKTLKEYIADCREFHDKGKQPDADHALQSRLLTFEDLCNAIDYAHARGVVHRDIKPENIMVGPYGEVIVMDWGIAKLIGTKDDPTKAVGPAVAEDGTQLGAAIGTPKYMSPEQAEGRNDELDGKSDQYALGLLLFELVTLSPANPGKNMMECWGAAQAARKAPFVHAYGAAIPKDLGIIIDKSTALETKNRYADVGQMAEDVRRFMRDEELLAKRDGLSRRVQRWVGHHRQATIAMVVAAAGLGVIGVTGSVAVGLSALSSYAYVADQREERLGVVLNRVAEQGHVIDAELQRYRGELRGLQSAGNYALANPAPSERAVYVAASFADPTTAPPDMVDSSVYETKASLAYPDNALAPGLDPLILAPRLQQLNSLQPQLYGMLVRAGGPAVSDAPPADQHKALLDTGVPMIWAYVATEDGILTGMPGTGDYPDDYDPRQENWYTCGLAADDVCWEAAIDESGQGLLLSAAAPLVGPDGRRIGVAALDIDVNHVASDLLAPGGLPAPVEALLMDDEGGVLVSTADPNAGATKPPFRHPEVASRVAAGEASGWAEIDGELVAWTRVDAVGWTYVVAGDDSALIGVLW